MLRHFAARTAIAGQGDGHLVQEPRDEEVARMGPRRRWLWLAPVAVVLGGCGGSGESPSAGPSESEAARQVLSGFLDAVRKGDDEAATALLSPRARQKLTPPASDTARFELGKVEKVSSDEVRIDCTWSDFDPYGERQTDESQWHLRRGSEGWRVTGMSFRVFADAPPVRWDFEDPEDMARKQQWVEAERRRRGPGSPLQARDGENSGNRVRR
jgi:hypothetical protein